MSLHPIEKANLRASHVRTLQRVVSLLTAVQSDLEVLGSEFSPDLHQINNQLDQLVKEMKHDPLDNQEGNPSDPEAPNPPAPVDPQPADQGSKPPAESRPDPAQ